ncbi:MAG: aldo/keto reductase, partial [Chitinophagaceae bacterium]|nr:aldo/keto reductase [Chitinophagaceae bacterium]
MKYNLLGKSDLSVSEIGFGCMSLPQDEKEAIKIIHAAIEKGINYFDTADVYSKGANEIIVGKALVGKRDKIILASKVGNVYKPDGSSGFNWDPSKKHILESIDPTLKRLNTDYLDLYQLHGGTMEDNIDETIEAFELLKQQGKIKHYGISSIRPAVINEYTKRSDIVSVMTQYSLLDRRPEEEILDLLYKNNISVLVRGALAQGLLAGKPAKPYLNLSAEEVQKISASINHSSHEAINYVFKHPAV